MAVTINGTTGIETNTDTGKVKVGASDDIQIHHTSGHSYVESGTGELHLKTTGDDLRLQAADDVVIQVQGGENAINCVGNGAVELYYDNALKFKTDSAGVQVYGAVIVDDGSSTGNRISVGGAGDLQIYHDGTHSHITNSTGWLKITESSSGGGIQYAANSHQWNNQANDEAILYGTENGAVELYYDGAKKLETKSNGAEVTGHFDPAAGNSYDLGYDHRWRVLYTNSNVDVSDRNEKQNITNSDLGIDFVNKLTPVSYQWKDVDNLGSKKQYGLIAQDVEQVILDSGKTLDDFGAISKREGKSMGISYNQLISPLIKAVQELSAEVETLKTKVAALEAHTHE